MCACVLFEVGKWIDVDEEGPQSSNGENATWWTSHISQWSNAPSCYSETAYSVHLQWKISPAWRHCCMCILIANFLPASEVIWLVTSSPRGGVKYCDEHFCLSLCLFVRLHISEIALTNFIIFVHDYSGSRDMLCTSCFVDDVVFSRNVSYGASCVFLRGERIA